MLACSYVKKRNQFYQLETMFFERVFVKMHMVYLLNQNGYLLPVLNVKSIG